MQTTKWTAIKTSVGFDKWAIASVVSLVILYSGFATGNDASVLHSLIKTAADTQADPRIGSKIVSLFRSLHARSQALGVTSLVLAVYAAFNRRNVVTLLSAVIALLGAAFLMLQND